MDTTRPSQNSPTPKSGVATPRTPSIELWSELNVVERRIARHIHSTVDGHFYRMYPGQLPPTIRHFYLNIFLGRYFLRTFHTLAQFPGHSPSYTQSAASTSQNTPASTSLKLVL